MDGEKAFCEWFAKWRRDLRADSAKLRQHSGAGLANAAKQALTTWGTLGHSDAMRALARELAASEGAKL